VATATISTNSRKLPRTISAYSTAVNLPASCPHSHAFCCAVVSIGAELILFVVVGVDVAVVVTVVVVVVGVDVAVVVTVVVVVGGA
jgi:hypothetical protein